MKPIVLVTALPRELHALTRGWSPVPGQPANVYLRRSGPHLAVCAGIGADRVSLALNSALRHSSGDESPRILSVGLAGACSPDLRAGAVLRCETVIDARSGERFRTADLTATPGSVLVTMQSVASVTKKSRLAATYGAKIVDMEAATLARLAQARGCDFLAVKAVSDEASFALPALDRFITPLGQFRESAFAFHAALHPGRWPQVLQLARNSGKALRSLAACLHRELHSSLH